MTSKWEGARRILCVRLDEMGDVLMTTPALRALKHHGDRTITLLTSRAGAEVARYVPEIDDVVIHEASWIKSAPPGRRAFNEEAMIAELRRRHFDAVAIFTVFSQSPLPAAYLCFLAGIPRRAAYCRENPYQLLTDHLTEVDEPPHRVRHEVRRQLDLVAALGFPSQDERLSLSVPAAARSTVDGLIGRLPLLSEGRWAIIHPGAAAVSRRYPPEHFAEVADLLVEREDWQVVFTGAGEDVAVVDDVRRRMHSPSLSLAGKLPLHHLLALIERAPVLVTNNTGPAHVAAALGTPVVVTYAQTNLQHTPWAEATRVLSYDVPCKYCMKSVCPEGHHNCLRLVSPVDVAHGAAELVSERATRARMVVST